MDKINSSSDNGAVVIRVDDEVVIMLILMLMGDCERDYVVLEVRSRCAAMARMLVHRNEIKICETLHHENIS